MTLVAAATVWLALFPGCAMHTMDIPANFVAVDKSALDGYDVRAVSADGVAVGLRSQSNPKNGSVEFWAEAIQNELTASKGYKLEKEEPLTSASGASGKLLVFSAQQSGADFTYMLAVFVRGDAILIAEAGGKADAVKPKMDALKAALRSAR